MHPFLSSVVAKRETSKNCFRAFPRFLLFLSLIPPDAAAVLLLSVFSYKKGILCDAHLLLFPLQSPTSSPLHYVIHKQYLLLSDNVVLYMRACNSIDWPSPVWSTVTYGLPSFLLSYLFGPSVCRVFIHPLPYNLYICLLSCMREKQRVCVCCVYYALVGLYIPSNRNSIFSLAFLSF